MRAIGKTGMVESAQSRELGNSAMLFCGQHTVLDERSWAIPEGNESLAG